MSGVLTFAAAGISFPRAVGVSSRPRMSAVAAPVRVVRRRSLYEVLRVKDTATADEIKAAYRSMAKRLHPDVAPAAAAAAEDFMEVRRAYETLSDQAERTRYDLSIGRLQSSSFAGAERFRSTRWETDQCW